jgi:hypothetical protein
MIDSILLWLGETSTLEHWQFALAVLVAAYAGAQLGQIVEARHEPHVGPHKRSHE